MTSAPPSIPDPHPGGDAPALFVYVKIPVDTERPDPFHSREEQIDQTLQGSGVGSVIGWGDSLGDEQADGSRAVAFHRIDITVADLTAARSALHTVLRTLDVASGTEIHYTIEGTALMDVLTPAGWLDGQAVAASRPRARLTRGRI
jgi:hypothetical protein